MRKLKLKLETLRVEAFDVNPSGRADRGTIRGHLPPRSQDIFCISEEPCVPSNEFSCVATTCMGTCFPTCYC